MKMLMIASVASMIEQFNMNNLCILHELGASVDIACNFELGNSVSSDTICAFKNRLAEMNIACYQIDFTRNPFDFGSHIKAYRTLSALIASNKYRFVHCHGPISGAIARLAARKHGIPAIYTAHGFHFFTGSPKQYWVLYYPIEKYLSKFTDVLLTINNQDYNLAKQRFKMKHLVKIPGVGVDMDLFVPNPAVRNNVREAFSFSDNDFALISVGEINENKNHIAVIEAMRLISVPTLHYLVVGQGPQEVFLKSRTEIFGLQDRVHFLGYRSDVHELLCAADLFVFPSLREGLGLAAIEALSTGVPVVGSNVGGIPEYVVDGVNGYLINPNIPSTIADAVMSLIANKEKRKSMEEVARQSVAAFSSTNVDSKMRQIYSMVLERVM